VTKQVLIQNYILEKLHDLYDIMQYIEETDITVPGLLFLIDFEKAFDVWQFIQETSNYFNFGSSIKKLIIIYFSKEH